MKRILYVALMGLMVSLTNCSDENQQPLINAINGSWTVTSIDVVGGEPSDSYFIPKTGTLTFDHCKASDSRSEPDACKGNFRADNEITNFSYTIHHEPSGQDMLNLYAVGRKHTGKLLSDPTSTWTFLRRTKREFTIERWFSYGKSGTVSIRINATKQ